MTKQELHALGPKLAAAAVGVDYVGLRLGLAYEPIELQFDLIIDRERPSVPRKRFVVDATFDANVMPKAFAKALAKAQGQKFTEGELATFTAEARRGSGHRRATRGSVKRSQAKKVRVTPGGGLP